MLPLVSIVTPTYNRRRFIPSLIKIVQSQTYPRDRMEWVVFDDGQEEVRDLFESNKDNLPTLNFIWSEDKMTLGEKRNRLNQEAKGDIIVAMDDDDFYFPERVTDAVMALTMNPATQLAGSSEAYMFFTDTKEIWKNGLDETIRRHSQIR
jgi:glycosyltransferase involved in cell wall biosynthesis